MATYVRDVLPVMVLLGTGVAVCFPVADDARDVGRYPEDAGLASGLVNTTVQVGGALGLAVLATLASTHTTAALHAGDAAPEALTGGYHVAFAVAAALVAAAIVVALTVLEHPAPERQVSGGLAAEPACTEAA